MQQPLQAKTTLLTFIDAINAHSPAAILAKSGDDFLFIDAWGNRQTKAEMQSGWPEYFAMFPDYRIEVEYLLEDEGMLAVFGWAGGSWHGRGGEDETTRWRIPAAWRAKVQNGRVSLWQVYADTKRPFDTMQAKATAPAGYDIRPLMDVELPEASALAQRVFTRFVAPGYTREGVQEFTSYIQPQCLAGLVQQGTLRFWGCFSGSALAGMLAVKNANHISLLFVEEAHQQKGIAAALWAEGLAFCRSRGATAVGVHSSPYALPVYQRMGFVQTEPEKEQNGIRYIPMQLAVE